MPEELRAKIESERNRIRTAAGKGMLDLQAVERLKALLRELETREMQTAAVPPPETRMVEKNSPKGEVS